MLTLQQLALLVVVLGLSVIAGLAVHLQKRRETEIARPYLHLLSEVSSSVIAGISVFYIGLWQELSEPLTCLASIIAASNGKTYLELITQILTNFIKQKLNLGNK